MHFSLLGIVFINLIGLQRMLAEGPPKKLDSEAHKQIIFTHINETVILKCPVESSSEYITFIEWTKGNTSLYMTQGYEITNKGHLKIKSVSLQQVGIYTCEAINGYGSVRINLTLVVDNPSVQNTSHTLPNRNSASRVHSTPPIITKRPSSVSADLDNGAILHCMSSGQPAPRIFWLKDGHLIQGASSYVSKRKTHSTLKLKGLKKSDAGTYKCIARNIAGEDEMDFLLHVTEPSPPPIIIALDPPNVTIREGATIAFVCEVVSRPGVQLHIKWLKKQDGIRESSNDINLFRSGQLYYRPLNLTDNEFIANTGVHKSKLLIRNSCEADSGTYVCLALNDKGFNVKNSTLKVIGTRNTIENKNLNFEEGSIPLTVTVTVGCVIIVCIVVFVSQICCRNKTEDKMTTERTPMPSIETGSLKHSMTSIRKPHNGDLNLEKGDPQSTSKLLAINSAFLYEHSESQMSQSTHTRTFH